MSLTKAQELAQLLDTQVLLVSNADHFNKKAGYVTVKQLLLDVKQFI